MKEERSALIAPSRSSLGRIEQARHGVAGALAPQALGVAAIAATCARAIRANVATRREQHIARLPIIIRSEFEAYVTEGRKGAAGSICGIYSLGRLVISTLLLPLRALTLLSLLCVALYSGILR